MFDVLVPHLSFRPSLLNFSDTFTCSFSNNEFPILFATRHLTPSSDQVIVEACYPTVLSSADFVTSLQSDRSPTAITLIDWRAFPSADPNGQFD